MFILVKELQEGEEGCGMLQTVKKVMECATGSTNSVVEMYYGTNDL